MKIKGFDENLCCRGMQFKIGDTYDTGANDEDLKLCSDTVFHYCDNLQQVHEYYSCSNNKNRFCEIKVLGKEITDGSKCGSNKIKILREITGDELDRLKGLINGNTGLFNTGGRNTGDCNTGNRNTGNRNTGNRNTGNRNTGDCNTGGRNTGDFNSCNNSSGFFCTKSPEAVIFNKPAGMTVDEFKNTAAYRALFSASFVLTEWINYSEDEMDTDEKKMLGGYLKKYTFKEACDNWWSKMSDENKKIIVETMPNFDAGIFEEITGIKV